MNHGEAVEPVVYRLLLRLDLRPPGLGSLKKGLLQTQVAPDRLAGGEELRCEDMRQQVGRYSRIVLRTYGPLSVEHRLGPLLGENTDETHI